ncbi:uncharacterized protein LOC113347555 [Papaver somniferum]|uniref:uncharacterized protein LOC113347555 n=1 Tax=Papaver somniferum TaxID=3469 RepID=UPI000E6FFA52|nr:uncharacterized protein LOC113347555 [Papaver somniferum]
MKILNGFSQMLILLVRVNREKIFGLNSNTQHDGLLMEVKRRGGFIEGRNIQEKIVLASEMVNELEVKRRGGNIGLKLDITQAYDSLSWNFLFKTSRHFGFSEVGINWLRILFESAKISVLVNEGALWFLFCWKGTSTRLSESIWPSDNRVKSKCFLGGVNENRRRSIAESLQMELSDFPDKYLGVVLNPGRVRNHQVWGMVELMNKILAWWMGKMLSFSERLTLVKSVLCSIHVYNMSVYRWPANVIKECEKIVRNFLWSGDPAVKKLITVKYEKICAPITEGGLGIRRFEVINKALLMKLL